MYNDEQLKQALAKMLPDVLGTSIESFEDKPDRFSLFWTIPQEYGNEVLDTELLHLCWLVEESLTKRECQDYTQSMNWEQTPNTPPYDYVWHATWQQRVIALAQVKGIEIV